MNLPQIGNLIADLNTSIQNTTPPLTQQGGVTLDPAIQIALEKGSADFEKIKLLLEFGKPTTAATLPSKEGELALLIKGQIVKFASAQLSTEQSFSPSTSLLLALTEQDGSAYLQFLKEMPGNETKIPIASSFIKDIQLGAEQSSQESSTVESLFQRILKAAAPDLPLQDLRSLLSTQGSSLQTDLLGNVTQKTEVQSDVVKQLLTHFSLNESDFESSTKMIDTLKQLLQPPSLATTMKDSTSLKSTEQNTTQKTNTPEAILKEAQAQVFNYIAQESLSPESAIIQLSQQLRALINLLPSKGAMPPLHQQLLSKEILGNDLLQTLKNSLAEIGNNADPSGASRETIKALSQLLTLIQNESSLTNTMRSAQEAKFTQQLASSLASPLASDSKSSDKTNPMSLLENFVQGQEALRRMGPLMKQIGEPMFLLIPGFIQGFLKNLEVSIYPNKEVDANTGKNSKQSNNGYQRLALSFTFPRLGDIRVDIAYKSDHVLMSFASQEDRVVDYIDQHLPKLQRSLYTLGFSRSELIARKSFEEQKPLQPSWLRKSLGTKAIA